MRYLKTIAVAILMPMLFSCKDTSNSNESPIKPTTTDIESYNHGYQITKIRLEISKSQRQISDSLWEIFQMLQKSSQYAVTTRDCYDVMDRMTELRKQYETIQKNVLTENSINPDYISSRVNRGLLGQHDTIEYLDSEDDFYYENQRTIVVLNRSIDVLSLKIDNISIEESAIVKERNSQSITNSNGNTQNSYQQTVSCSECGKRIDGYFYFSVLGNLMNIPISSANDYPSHYCSVRCLDIAQLRSKQLNSYR